MANFFIIRNEDEGVMERLPACALHALQHAEQGGDARFVIQMAGFDIAVRKPDRAGVERYVIPGSDAEPAPYPA